MFETMIQPIQTFGGEAFAALLDAAAKSSLLLLAAFAFAFAARRRSAAQRHLLWTVAVVAALAMPLLSRVAPVMEIPLLVGPPAPVEPLVPLPAVAAPEPPASVGLGVGVPAPPVPSVGPVVPPLPGAGRSGLVPAPRGVPSTTDVVERGAAIPVGALLALWAVGSLLVLAYLLVGTARLSWLARRAPRVASGPLWRETRRVSDRLGLRRMPVIVQGDDAAIPMTWGLRRAYLLLPAGAEAWAGWCLEAILLHELGHVRRRDYLSQTCAHIACALYWFNPLVWLAAHRMRVEREHACDDLVVSAGHEATRYADELLRLARSFRLGTPSETAALALARPNRFRERLVALLDQTRARHPLTRRRAVSVSTLAIAATLFVAGLAPANSASAEEAAPTLSTGGFAAGEAVSVQPPAVQEGPETVEGQPRESERLPRVIASAFQPAPAFQQTSGLQQASVLCGPADGEPRRRASLSDDGVRTIEAEYGGCRSSVRIEGDIEFTDDFSGVARLSSGALLRFEVERGGSERRLEVRPGSGGRPDYAWAVDGRNQLFDASAQAWLASALLDLFRSSSYMARERAAWILGQEGPEGIFAEVRLMLADHAQSTYLAILLEEDDLSGAQVRRTIELAGREIQSDHSLGEVLMAAATRYPFDAPTRTAFLQAATSIESDHTQGQIFQAALATGELSRENLDLLLRTASSSIESDHTMGEILMQLASRYALEPELREPFLRAAATLGSDHTAGQVYGVLLQQEGLRSDELAAILDAATEIESDHTLGELLRTAAARHDLSDATLRGAFLRAAATIGSDHTRGSVYREAMALGLSDAEMSTILDAVGEIGSDHELASLLVETADRGLSGVTLQRAFLRAASRIGSDHSLSTTLMAFAAMDDVAPAEQIELLATARGIGGDHSLAEFLIAFADHHPVEGAVREAFMETMDEIGSRHDRDRVASAIVRR